MCRKLGSSFWVWCAGIFPAVAAVCSCFFLGKLLKLWSVRASCHINPYQQSHSTVPGMLAAWKHCHGLDCHPQSHLSWEHLVSISLGISRERWNFIGIPTEIANVSVPSALPKGHIQPSFARWPIRTWNIQPQSRVNTFKGNAACTSVQYGVACPWAQNSWIALLYCHSYYPGTVPQNPAPPLSPKLKLSRPATLYQKANDFNMIDELFLKSFHHLSPTLPTSKVVHMA